MKLLAHTVSVSFGKRHEEILHAKYGQSIKISISNQTGLDCCHPNTKHKIKVDWTDVIQKQHQTNQNSMSKLLDHAVSVSLGERHKTIPMSGWTL